MQDIDTRLFRYFVAVAEEKQFARASVRLGITPPTLTHQIQKLEHLLGVQLFKRRAGSTIELTEAGKRLLDHARKVLLQTSEAQLAAQQAARGEVGRIEIGFMPSATFAGIMHKCIGEFQRKNPAIEIILRQMVPMAQLNAIVRQDLNCGFMRSPFQYPTGLDGFVLERQPMVLAMPRNHPLARQKRIDPRKLRNETFVNTALELDLGFWGHSEALAEVGKFVPKVVKGVPDMITVLTYVSAGYGIGMVPKHMSRMDVPNVTYRDFLPRSVAPSSIAFIYRRNDPSPAASLLQKYMRGHALASEQRGSPR
jgi:DNA-binding transcriptional LysR family regulator